MVFEVTAPKSNALQLTDGEGREAGSFVGQATRRSVAVLITGGVLVLTFLISVVIVFPFHIVSEWLGRRRNGPPE